MAIRSNSKAAKTLIRSEIRRYYPSRGSGSSLRAMKRDADAANGGTMKHIRVSDYYKGRHIANDGNLAYYPEDQAVMLGRIYGKEKVRKWDAAKIHATYCHLIGREYDAMLREQRAKAAKKPAAKKPIKKGGRK